MNRTDTHLAAEELRQMVKVLATQMLDASGVIDEFMAMPCDSLKNKLPTTSIRLKRTAEDALALTEHFKL